jgi:type I restriction enzyme S subunit
MAERFVTLAEISINGKGAYGIGASAVPYSDDLYTYLRITDINDDGTLNLNDLKSVDDDKAKDYLLKPNDIVFARTGASTGRNYFYDGTDGMFVYAGFLIKFSIDEKKVNPKYVKYYCQSSEYRGWINSFNTGSTRGNINAQTLGKLPIPLIDRRKQDVLVSILSSIDEKIKHNTQINNNLYLQCKLKFQNIFSPYFNDESYYVPLSELASFKYGTMPKKEKLGTGSYIAFSGYQAVGSYPEMMFEQPQLIIIARGVGGCGDIKFSPSNCYLTNLSIAIMPQNNLYEDYLFFFLRGRDTKVLNTGSAQPQITISTLEKYLVTNPPREYIVQFADFVKPYKELYRNNQAEIEKLQLLRDILLNKLMSGELDVSNIDL